MFQDVDSPSVVLGGVTRTAWAMSEGLDSLYDWSYGDVCIGVHTTESSYEVVHDKVKKDKESREAIQLGG